jgi:hypothetical protein
LKSSKKAYRDRSCVRALVQQPLTYATALTPNHPTARPTALQPPNRQVVEEHVSSATSAVVTVPQRAVKKAARGIAKNTKKLFGAPK